MVNQKSRLARRISVATLVMSAGLFSVPSRADTSSVSGVLEDTGLYFTAPLRWNERDWLQLGASVAAIGLAHQLDDNVRSHFVPANGAASTTSDPHSFRDFEPTIAMLGGTWLAAFAFHDRSGYEEGREMLEAGAFSAVSTEIFKLAAGRLRPSQTTDHDRWREGGDSFPSRHVSIAFAVGTVLAESGSDEFRLVRRVLGYGLSAATAYSRMRDNQHWLSDTVAGAALGIATAQFVMHRGRADVTNANFSIAPVPGGVLVSYAFTFN